MTVSLTTVSLTTVSVTTLRSNSELDRAISGTRVRVDRASALGNPFAMAGEFQRDRVCELYRKFLWAIVRPDSALGNNDSALIAIKSIGDAQPVDGKWLLKGFTVGDIRCAFFALCDRSARGEAIALQCWCAPKRCHADVIKSAIDWSVSQVNG